EDLATNFVAANEELLGACAQRPGFVPCPIVIPNAAGDVPPEDEQVAALLACGAGAACIRPKRDHWILADWVAGPLLEALQGRRVPVFCRPEQIALEEVAELAGRYPDLPIIVAEAGYRSQRVLLRLLATFGRVHVCLGGAYSVHRGVEQLVGRVGAERVLFGTGYPDSEPTAAVTQLMYADISDAQRSSIGAGNMERLMEEIAR
ncbi:hypothetical protein LCGC14_2809570, partial [marine sediment metagenome]